VPTSTSAHDELNTRDCSIVLFGFCGVYSSDSLCGGVCGDVGEGVLFFSSEMMRQCAALVV
jgi:hypothetical protein